MRKSVFYSLKTFTQGRVLSADASTGSISYKVDAMHFRIGTISCESVFIGGQLIQLTQFGIITKPCCHC